MFRNRHTEEERIGGASFAMNIAAAERTLQFRQQQESLVLISLEESQNAHEDREVGRVEHLQPRLVVEPVQMGTFGTTCS